MKFIPFEDARRFVHSLKLKGKREWEDYCKSGRKPPEPYHPDRTYKKQHSIENT
ncbi:MAG: hypothetical protein WB664_04025 [Nitrososphaeraceae archaeon]